MRVLVCVKRVPAPGARINVAPDGGSVDTAHLGFTISPHEECAVEEAVQLVEANGGSVTVLTAGPPAAADQLRYAASVGGQELALVVTDPSPPAGDGATVGTDWDPQRTATVLVDAVRELEDEGGSFDLVLFGNESADSGGFQVGIRVAHALGRPIVNGIKRIEIDGGADGSVDGGEVVAHRAVDAGFEVYRLPFPAVLGVKEGINLPRYPTMKGRLASKKAELKLLELTADPGDQCSVRLHRPPEQASTTERLGDAAAVVDLLEELGVLS